MFSKKKTECRVCGYRFTPERENIYTAEEPRSMADMLTKAPTRFSAVDCPICGCQIALAIRAYFLRSSKRAQMRTDNGLHEGRQGLPAQLLTFVRKAGEE